VNSGRLTVAIGIDAPARRPLPPSHSQNRRRERDVVPDSLSNGADYGSEDMQVNRRASVLSREASSVARAAMEGGMACQPKLAGDRAKGHVSGMDRSDKIEKALTGICSLKTSRVSL
jgi:hypothetical protein